MRSVVSRLRAALRLRPKAIRRPKPGVGEISFDPMLFQEWGALLVTIPDDRPASALVERLRAAIDNLPSEERDVVNALFYEGIEQTEVARRLRISRYHVKRRLQSAVRTLKAVLEDT